MLNDNDADYKYWDWSLGERQGMICSMSSNAIRRGDTAPHHRKNSTVLHELHDSSYWGLGLKPLPAPWLRPCKHCFVASCHSSPENVF